METIFQNTIAASLLICSLGYLIYKLGGKVKSLSNKWTPGCHDEDEKDECDSCLIAPKNRGIVTSIQKTL